jgi:hypothetical protein
MPPRPLGLDPEDPLVRQAVFGQEVQDFLRTPIGDFLIKRAETQLAQAIEKLKTVPPELSGSIAKLQVEIQFLERFEGWLGEAVQAGLTAVAIIDGEIDAEDA